ncbi:MAG: hypothetical protein ACJ762_06880 [Solirubrobacteraceae bacterium]
MEEHEPTTQELRAVQRDRQEAERQAADDAPTESAELAHTRRADKAAYLEERLAEQQRAEEEGSS